MKQPLWQRRRSAQVSKDEAERADSEVDKRDTPTPPRHPADIRARLRDLESQPPPEREEEAPAAGTDRQAAYAAWADRMKTHKREKLADITPDPNGATRSTSPYWDSSTLFAPPDPDAKPDPSLMANDELLGILGLAPGATTADIQSAFRRLAKEHHPDRWHNAEPDVRTEHEARMTLIVEAHRELRRRT